MSEQLAATTRGLAFMLCATALLGLGSGCGSPKDFALATISRDAAASDAAVSDAAAGDAGLHQPCTLPSQCGPGTFCSTPAAMCDAPGTCEPTVSCSDNTYSPVCGCNMVTYLNDCERLKAGVSVKFGVQCGVLSTMMDGGSTVGGPMGQCDVRTNAGCMNGTKCAGLYLIPRGICGSDFVPPPSCWAIPESCSGFKWDPCGSGESCVDTCKAIDNRGVYTPASCQFQR
jgi:hypothetical protein